MGLLAALVVAVASNVVGSQRAEIGDDSRPAIGSLEQIDHSIRAWTANLAANDRDFYAATNLGRLYEARGRLTADVADYGRAREALDRALRIVPDDLSAQLLHARVLLVTHDFAAALAEARAVVAAHPGEPQALAAIGDASLELGDLSMARAMFDRLSSEAPGAPVTARLSRLAFITGDLAAALELAERAFGEARLAGERGAALGWYAALAGSTSLAAGNPGGARAWFEQALSMWPAGQLPLAGAARAELALGRGEAAEELLRHAAAVAPQPDIIAVLGDLALLRGDAARAEEHYQTIDAIGRLGAVNEQVFNRQLVLFAASHGRNLPMALLLAERELAVRKDVYGYDAYAWALLANGRPADADAAMREALAAGTQDSLLDYHAGMIKLALGELDEAERYLTGALSRRGALDPLAAHTARQVLEVLR